MKKFLCLLAVSLLMVGFTAGCTSCNTDVHWGIEYALQSDGVANGNVMLTFDGGSFTLNGESNYALEWHNSFELADGANPNAISLEQALCSKDANNLTGAQRVEEWLNNSISVTSAGGTYDIYVKGYVKETATGLTFAIDRHFTNIPDEEPDADPE